MSDSAAKTSPEAASDNIRQKSLAVTYEDFLKGVFGGKGMEGMAMRRDGSTGDIRMGHDFVCASLVGARYPEALPVYVKLGRGRKGHDELPTLGFPEIKSKPDFEQPENNFQPMFTGFL